MQMLKQTVGSHSEPSSSSSWNYRKQSNHFLEFQIMVVLICSMWILSQAYPLTNYGFIIHIIKPKLFHTTLTNRFGCRFKSAQHQFSLVLRIQEKKRTGNCRPTPDISIDLYILWTWKTSVLMITKLLTDQVFSVTDKVKLPYTRSIMHNKKKWIAYGMNKYIQNRCAMPHLNSARSCSQKKKRTRPGHLLSRLQSWGW